MTTLIIHFWHSCKILFYLQHNKIECLQFIYMYHLTNKVKKTLKLLLSIFGQFTCTSEGNFFFIIKFYICCCTWEKSGRRNEPFNATKRCHYFHIIIFNFKHFSHKYIWVERRFLVHFIFRNPQKAKPLFFNHTPKKERPFFRQLIKELV